VSDDVPDIPEPKTIVLVPVCVLTPWTNDVWPLALLLRPPAWLAEPLASVVSPSAWLPVLVALVWVPSACENYH
jgi:hypothetical protein